MRLIAPPLSFVAAFLLLTSAAAGAAIRQAASFSQPASRPFLELSSVPLAPAGAPPAHPPAPTTPMAAPGTPASEVERWNAVLSRDAETSAALRRLRPYAPLIHEALSSSGIPAEFAALPIIESAYRPQATSRAGAAGMWQLMPATARAYGLEVSLWVDERRDPVRSTEAATRHLRDLYVELGSWHLAAAAYNCGSTRLREAVGPARHDSAYWIYRYRLPAQTRAYVPKLLAAMRIARANGATRRDFDFTTPLRFAEVRIPGGVSLSDVAVRYGFTEDTLARLNPHLVRGATPPGRPWPVRIPAQ